MSVADSQKLESECRIFTRYLIGDKPAKEILSRYEAAFAPEQETAQALTNALDGRFDRLLLSLAVVHPIFTRAVDIYSRFFYPDSIVRKRLILLLAILESWGSSYYRLDRLNKPVSVYSAIMGFVLHVLVVVPLFIVTAPFLLPMQVLLKRSNRPEIQGDIGKQE